MKDSQFDDYVLYYAFLNDSKTPEQKKKEQEEYEAFRKEWAGRRFRCKSTGLVLIIPKKVRYKDYFAWGNSSIDVGDGYYARYGGDVEEI